VGPLSEELLKGAFAAELEKASKPLAQ
jgi:hypothetical protein